MGFIKPIKANNIEEVHNIMWLFEAEYSNMDCDSSIKSVRRKIEFDGDIFLIRKKSVIYML